jgi:hypothetical protein
MRRHGTRGAPNNDNYLCFKKSLMEEEPFDDMKAGLTANQHYYEHPDFAARLIIKKYAAIQKKHIGTAFSQ